MVKFLSNAVVAPNATILKYQKRMAVLCVSSLVFTSDLLLFSQPHVNLIRGIE